MNLPINHKFLPLVLPKGQRVGRRGLHVRISPLAGPTAIEFRDFLAGEEAATPELRRSGLFVANGCHLAKSPVGAASSASMPLLRSFPFLPFAIYKYAAPMGLGKARLALNSTAGHPGPLPQGEGTAHPAQRRVAALRIGESVACGSPSPRGEGRGEGEETLRKPARWRTADGVDYSERRKT